MVKTLEKYRLGRINERGSRLLGFCEKFKLAVGNTLFMNSWRRRYTGISPRDAGRYQVTELVKVLKSDFE